MRSALFVVATFMFAVCGLAQSISYEFSAPNSSHHEAEIAVTAYKLPAGPALFRMSRSSPGRYATHEFGKNVYNVKAVDPAGKPLKIEKADADVYRVSGHNGTVKVTYTLFGNHADGTYTGIDPTSYHLNMPATFMWVKGMEKAPITIKFVAEQPTWKVATQLAPTADPFTFKAPHLQYFMDSPTKLGDLIIKEWTVTNPNQKQYTFRLALEAEATPAQADSFAHKIQQIVAQAKAVFGEVPAFDYGSYTFIASINPYVRGDGMEHRNSTMITIPTNFRVDDNLLGVFSHEFFHCWNVERIRPQDIEPFNFEKSNMSSGLWVAEGFTQYYGDLILTRAGLMPRSEFVDVVQGFINTKTARPGAQMYTPIENSQRAVFVDAGVSIDKTNYPNMYTSYYFHGGALALALDLELRGRFTTSLDRYMQELWKRHGKTGKPYTLSDLQTALAAISTTTFAADFFNRYVYDHQPFDYNRALASAGWAVQPANKGKAWLGPVNFVQNRDLTLSQTIINTPLYNAGLDAEDVLVSIDDTTLQSRRDIEMILNKHQPGDILHVVYKHRGATKKANVTLTENIFVEIKPLQTLAADPQTATFIENWMGDKTTPK